MMFINMIILVLVTFTGCYASCGVTLSCGSDDVRDQGPAGPAGKKGSVGMPGMQGLKGTKGEPGENDGWRDSIQRLEERISVLENQQETISANLSLIYTSLGCWTDISSNRAIPTAEGTHSTLDGTYHSRRNPIEKCAHVARERGYKVFALQNGGWCATSINAQDAYKKYGASTACGQDGEGGPGANHVYQFQFY